MISLVKLGHPKLLQVKLIWDTWLYTLKDWTSKPSSSDNNAILLSIMTDHLEVWSKLESLLLPVTSFESILA